MTCKKIEYHLSRQIHWRLYSDWSFCTGFHARLSTLGTRVSSPSTSTTTSSSPVGQFEHRQPGPLGGPGPIQLTTSHAHQSLGENTNSGQFFFITNYWSVHTIIKFCMNSGFLKYYVFENLGITPEQFNEN